MIDEIRQGVAGAVRVLPGFRGLGRTWRLANRGFLALGASPVVEALLRDGTRLTVDLRTETEREAYWRGTYDAADLAMALAHFDPDSVFLDVGANIGFYSVAAAQRIRHTASGGHVLAFEPFAGNLQRLGENLSRNDLSTRCTVHDFGLSDREGNETLTLREDFRGGSSTGNAAIATSQDFDAGFPTVQIRLQRLDDVWPAYRPRLPAIGFVKLDIEGHEDCFLRGAAQTLAQCRPTVMMEVNKPYYASRNVDLDDGLLGALPEGYRVWRRNEGAWTRIESLHGCGTLENVLLVPGERGRPWDVSAP